MVVFAVSPQAYLNGRMPHGGALLPNPLLDGIIERFQAIEPRLSGVWHYVYFPGQDAKSDSLPAILSTACVPGPIKGMAGPFPLDNEDAAIYETITPPGSCDPAMRRRMLLYIHSIVAQRHGLPQPKEKYYNPQFAFNRRF